MTDKRIPTHEPEVIQAAARKHWLGEEKVPTTALKVVEVHGVSLSSRWDKGRELEAMGRMVEGVEPDLRSYIESIWCDSKAEACYSVNMANCSEEVGRKIAHQLDMACRDRNGGHNGIWISGNRGADLTRDPWWHWGDED